MADSIKLGDKDYALVPARLKRFREEHIHASIDSNPTYNPDGSITFKTIIIQDLTDVASARGSGTARYTEKELTAKAKQFEKLETISVGRALASLGYLNDGQVASTEEMEDFESYQQLQKQEAIDNAVELIAGAKSNADLDVVIKSIRGLLGEPAVLDAGKKKRAELSDGNS